MDASIPQKQCRICNQFKPATTEFFHRHTANPDGLRIVCKECRNASLRKPPKPVVEDIIPPGMKRCRSCKLCKPATTEFFNATALYQSPDGLNKQCKECRKAYRSNLNKAEPKEARPQSDTKKCRICEKDLPATLEYFSYNKITKDRLCTFCKECGRTKSKEYRARPGGKESRRIYRAIRADVDRMYRKAYHQAHQEYEQQYRKAYRAAHQERDRAYRKAYRQRPDIALILSARYHRRRARKIKAGGEYTANDVQRMYQAQHGCCYYCKKKFHKGKYAYHVDHIVPLSRGGSNDASNIVLACPRCNLSKGTKLLHEWPEGGRLL